MNNERCLQHNYHARECKSIQWSKNSFITNVINLTTFINAIWLFPLRQTRMSTLKDMLSIVQQLHIHLSDLMWYCFVSPKDNHSQTSDCLCQPILQRHTNRNINQLIFLRSKLDCNIQRKQLKLPQMKWWK